MLPTILFFFYDLFLNTSIFAIFQFDFFFRTNKKRREKINQAIFAFNSALHVFFSCRGNTDDVHKEQTPRDARFARGKSKS